MILEEEDLFVAKVFDEALLFASINNDTVIIVVGNWANLVACLGEFEVAVFNACNTCGRWFMTMQDAFQIRTCSMDCTVDDETGIVNAKKIASAARVLDRSIGTNFDQTTSCNLAVLDRRD